jgi:hypothetical protein
MALVAYSEEEQVEAFGQVFTLRLDFHSITVMEGDTGLDMPDVVALVRSGRPSYSLLSRVLWALFREHHPETTLGQCMSIVMDKGKDAVKVGFALDALLNRAFPPPKEDRKPKKEPTRNGRSKSSAVAG